MVRRNSEYRNKKKRSQEHEKRLSEILDFEQTKASGSYSYDKGDGKDEEFNFLYELKETRGKSIHIKGEWLAKIVSEAEKNYKKPALIITIDGIHDFFEKDYVILRKSDFAEIIGKNIQEED